MSEIQGEDQTSWAHNGGIIRVLILMEESKFRAGFSEKLEYVKGDSEKRKT